uniref:C2H2-type domain-containing protein n=1 Tax=Lutzomyia longipalpis TaxID=7200 RepID=A0A1B0CE38_LUTLO
MCALKGNSSSSFGSIDFSAILEEEFLAMEAKENARRNSSQTDLDISLLAGDIVTNALHIPRSLFCPFCAEEYMFQFTLKDHLKREHHAELQQHVGRQRAAPAGDVSLAASHACSVCGALFFHMALLPKHILKRHGRTFLQHWQKENAAEMEKPENPCQEAHHEACVATPSKSILKKTPIKGGRIITSPSSVSIRRTKSDYVKRCTPVRRELRFDLPPLKKKSPEEKLPPMPRDETRSSWRLPFGWRNKKPPKAPPQKGVVVLTSTPINGLDDTMDVPSFFDLERFQCARCRKTWDNNAELLEHLKGHHRSARHFMRPHYRCAQCGATFYRNSYLVRHCHFHHTPLKTRQVIRN